MFFSLEMHNGFLHLRYDFGFSTGPVLLEDSMRKAQINDAKFHEVEMQLQSQPFDNYPSSSKAAILFSNTNGRSKRARWWCSRAGRRVEHMPALHVKGHIQVPPLLSGWKGRLSLSPGKSALVERFCVLLAKVRTVHVGEKVLLIQNEIISRTSISFKYTTLLN